MSQAWKSYEEVASYLLNQFATEFGLSRIEGKQKVTGKRSGTEWEIDAKGIKKGDEGFVIIECRRYTKSRQNQEKTAALAYRIKDTEAEGGILVSPLGIQEGAAKIVKADNIVSVQLGPNSTPHEFSMRFLNKLMVGIRSGFVMGDSCSAEVIRTCANCGQKFEAVYKEKLCSTCAQ